MNAVDELFGGSAYDHPKLRMWISRLGKGAAFITVRRPWNGFTRLRPELFIEFVSPSGELFVDSAPWEPGLNNALVVERVHARTLDDEAQRFSLHLQAQFEPLALRYGDDYFNAVLVQYMHEMKMDTEEIIRMMPEVTTYPPHQGPRLGECREDIKAVLGKAARDLTQYLDYSKIEAVDLIIAALADYLDERFSVTSRRILGWARQPEGFWTLVAELAPSFPGAQKHAQWRAKASDIATYLRSRGFNATAVTIERELLNHAADDSSFPWMVTLEASSRKLVFTPKSQTAAG